VADGVIEIDEVSARGPEIDDVGLQHVIVGKDDVDG
jgi:hypothetical protein